MFGITSLPNNISISNTVCCYDSFFDLPSRALEDRDQIFLGEEDEIKPITDHFVPPQPDPCCSRKAIAPTIFVVIGLMGWVIRLKVIAG